ncbi:MAG: hypothetical protein RLZZ244_1745 [Verrucomicrobiota bacterium]
MEGAFQAHDWIAIRGAEAREARQDAVWKNFVYFPIRRGEWRKPRAGFTRGLFLERERSRRETIPVFRGLFSDGARPLGRRRRAGVRVGRGGAGGRSAFSGPGSARRAELSRQARRGRVRGGCRRGRGRGCGSPLECRGEGGGGRQGGPNGRGRRGGKGEEPRQGGVGFS